MKYKQALTVGTQAEGTIQCTYATLYDKRGRALFSLQRKNFEQSDAYLEYLHEYGYDGTAQYGDNKTIAENYVYTADGQEGVILWDMHGRGQVDIDNAPTGLITFDVPLVAVDSYSPDRLVPCKLLLPAVEYLQRTIKSAKKVTKYTIYKINEDGTRGQTVMETYTKPDFDKLEEENCGCDIDPKALARTWEDLLKRINTNDVLYVKPAAFRWEITQVRTNSNDLTDPDSALGRMEAAKEKYEKAKAVLVAAGLTNLI